MAVPYSVGEATDMTYTDDYDDYEVVIGKAADGSALRGDARLFSDTEDREARETAEVESWTEDSEDEF